MPRHGRKTTNHSSKFDLGGGWLGREAALLALAASQHGVVALSQLLELGFSASAVRSRVAAGRLHRVHQGVYAVGRPEISRDGRYMAAVLACAPDAFLSHASAGALHEIRLTAQTRIDVTVAVRSARRHRGLRIHRSTSLRPADCVRIRNIPCTSLALTLCDLAATIPVGALEQACARAEANHRLDMAAIDDVLGRRQGRPGTAKLRQVLGRGPLTSPGASELELRFLSLCRHAGLPEPEINQHVPLAGEEIKVDFVWRDRRLIVETDGYETHGGALAFQNDRRRDQLLQSEGWRVVRFTWDDVVRRSEHVIRVLQTTLLRAA
jgi:very-short-patch-repair endonuclease